MTCKYYGVLMIFTLLFCSCRTNKLSEHRIKPHITFIMADDLGYGDLGCYGQTKIKTLNLDKMAAEAMIFTNHYSGSSICMPSRASLLTGYDQGHASVRGNHAWTQSGNPVNLSPNELTAATELNKAGYKTAVIGKWGLSEGDTNNSMPSNKDVNGISLLPELLGDKSRQEKHDFLYWEFNEREGPIQAIRKDEWKLV